MPAWSRFALPLALVAAVLAMQPGTGSIEGLITSDAGPVPGTIVQSRHLMSGATAQSVSGPSGEYRIAGLRQGRYSLWVEAREHSSQSIPQLLVEAGQITRRDIRLLRSRPREP